MPWPQWAGKGPLAFIASVDCAALPHQALSLALPADGVLLFFYFDGQVDNHEALVMCDDPQSQAGARVIYVPAGAKAVERAMPEGLSAYPLVPLTAHVEASVPSEEEPVLAAAFLAEGQDPEELYDHPVFDEDFLEAVFDAWPGPRHRIGGFADPVQGPVQQEAAMAWLGQDADWDGTGPGDQRVRAEADRLLLLAQFDSDDDADMAWGDGGCLYWLIRPEDLAARRFENALLTWQC